MKVLRNLSLAELCLCFAAPLFAGFGSTETFLPAVGRVPGQGGAQFYTTVWATNLTSAPQTMTFRFLKQGQANGSPASFVDTLQPGETKVYENVVESKLGLNNAIGAARVTSTGEIFVSERIFNQAPGADLGNTEGLFFAGVPKSFSISAGQSASIQGINQGGAENFRYNFALVETGGGSPSVNVQVFDGSGTLLGQKAYPLQPYEQLQPGVADVVPGIKTTNARITATVTGGTGSVLLAGAQLANVSQDSSGFEMSFRDDLLGAGGGIAGVTSLNGLTGALTLTPGSGISITPSGSSISIAYTGGGGAGGITSVTHDASLSGAGTGASPLTIAAAGVNTPQLAANAVQAGNVASGQVVKSVNGLHDAVTLAAGSNVTITPSGSTLTIASSGGGGGGLTLPFSGSSSTSATSFAVSNTGGGMAIQANSNATGFGPPANSFAVKAVSTGDTGTGVYGSTHGASGEGGYTGVWGDSHDATAVTGTSFNDRGVLGITSSDSAAAAVEGLNRSSFGVGVLGTLAGGSGVPKPGLAGIAVWGDGNNGVAGTGKYFGVIGVSGTGVGVSADSTSGYGLRAHSSGNLAIYCDGQGQYTVSWSKTSDARFKENVEPLERALERTLMLRGVSFDWRRDEFPERHFSTHRDIGFLAQEVEEVYPHLVTTDREGYKSVDYSALTPILVEAIKAQQGTISDLQARIEELRERFERLERNSTDSGARTAERRDPQERGRVAEEKEAAR
jgi:hypothetical protein